MRTQHLRLQVLLNLCVVLFCGAANAADEQSNLNIARINGKPNFNGIWQAMNTAHWNLEAHPACHHLSKYPADLDDPTMYADFSN